MAHVYVFDQHCEDFTNFGLVGALTPTSCVFEEEANGMSEITLEHPIDALGRYTALSCNNIIMADVPVRTTPEIDGTSIVTSVETWVVRDKAVTTKGQRTMYSKKSGGRRIKVLPAGLRVTVVKKPDEGRVKVKTKYGSGWMNRNGLEYESTETIPDNSQAIESVQPAWTVKPQLFRIYNVEKDLLGLTVSARHISYDLLFNLTTFKNTAAVPCSDALSGIMENCVADHEFEAYTNLISTHTGINWTRTNPISALLDPEAGLTALYGASLVRDNWELYILHDPGLNRGVTVEYGKNMTGIKYTESFEDVVTRIIPIGEKKDGDPLLLAGDSPWVDSPRIADYPVVYAQTLECENCKVGTNGVTTAIARARMQEQAQAVFDDGGDLPSVEMSVDFINLGDTAEYARFKDLERLFLWDYVLVRHKLHGIDVTSRIVKIQWDCLLDRMNGMEIGSVGKTLANSGITTWQIPTGFSGSKIAGGTVGGGALQSDIITSRHIQSDVVSADHIQAGAVTAEKIHAGTVEAISLEAVTAKIESLTAADIKTDRLAAAVAAFTVVTAGAASFDQATIQHLVSNAMNLQYGVAGEVFIENLRVLYGQMLQATIGDLCIKASDGNYYNIDVGPDGNVTATKNTAITDGEINAGQTNAGRVILETHITAESLNTGNLLATYALVNKIDTARIDVAELFANTAFIGALTTNTIVGDKSITIMAQDIAANEAAIAAQNQSLADAVTRLDKDIADIQSQVDGSITTWYLEGEPTASNEPAVNWTTEAEKEAHQGDLYYDKTTGYSYRWMQDGTSWLWKRVADTDVSEALALASTAKDTADAKKRIFYTQPTPPYDAGDLWVQGSGGDIYVCKSPKLAGFTFVQSDWQIASKYTDDTKANAAQSAADAAQTAANNAQASADAAQSAADSAALEADSAGELAQNAVDAIGEIPQRVVVKPDGLYLKDEKNASIVKINSGSVTIGTLVGEGKGYSQFAANYVQFGNYQMRRTADGGLAFKLTEVIA